MDRIWVSGLSTQNIYTPGYLEKLHAFTLIISFASYYQKFSCNSIFLSEEKIGKKQKVGGLFRFMVNNGSNYIGHYNNYRSTGRAFSSIVFPSAGLTAEERASLLNK